MSVYDTKPDRFLDRLYFDEKENPTGCVCCAGYELEVWRCEPFADHLVEWLPEYALAEPDLTVNHGNMYIKLKQAAIRVYTSEKYKNRGEAGEIALHAICRDFFNTIPICPRVFYKTASNDVVKSFDLVHARLPEGKPVELWLGESKLYEDRASAIAAAITSIRTHLDQGFLKNEKLLLGPQIPNTTPRREEIMELFKPQVSLDKFIAATVIPIAILAESDAVKTFKAATQAYIGAATVELALLTKALKKSKLPTTVRLVLIYVPLGSKESLVQNFDSRLKGLQ